MMNIIHRTDDFGSITGEVIVDSMVCFSTVFTSTVYHTLKETIDEVIMDPSYSESDLVCTEWMEKKRMSDNYEDDLGIAGPGLAAETAEGTSIPTGTITEDYLTRYLSRKFSLKIMVTEETVEDCKYEKVVDAARHLKRAMFKTMDIDMTNILVRATNASYVGGDGVALASTAHTLANGGTFSNMFAVAQAPSRLAIINATSQIRKYPGRDGITEGYEPRKIVCPTEQWAVWDEILHSTHAPEAGQFNAINVVNKRLNLTAVAIPYWDNTTTEWGIITSAENGIQYRMRRKPRTRNWVDNDQEVFSTAISSRWSRGWTEPRGYFHSAA
jgi:hypothetical protein